MRDPRSFETDPAAVVDELTRMAAQEGDVALSRALAAAGWKSSAVIERRARMECDGALIEARARIAELEEELGIEPAEEELEEPASEPAEESEE